MTVRQFARFQSRSFISNALALLFIAVFTYFSLSQEIRGTNDVQKENLREPTHVNLDNNYYSKTSSLKNDSDDVLPQEEHKTSDAEDQSSLPEEEINMIEEVIDNDNMENDKNHNGSEEEVIENENVENDKKHNGSGEGEYEEVLCSSYDGGRVLSPQSNIPQQLSMGSFTSDSSSPYLGKDIWAELVDNRRTFFLRQYEPGFPNMTELREWVSSQPHPITLVMNNYRDMSFPTVNEQKNLDDRELLELLMNETNLRAFYVENIEYFPLISGKYLELPIHPKMKSLPRGPKWQWKSKKLFGESKAQQKSLYSSISSSAEETEKLFRQNRSATVWVKSSYETNDVSMMLYFRDQSLALRRPIANGRLCQEYLKNAPETKVCSCGFPMNQTSSFPELLKHRFVISPSGISLDSYFTWDALLSGCIPIVPESPLDSMWEDLPVWIVHSWDEVTDDAVRKKAVEMSTKEYNFEKLFSSWWEKEIYSGLCKADRKSVEIVQAELSVNRDGSEMAKATSQDTTSSKKIEKGTHEYITGAIGPDNSTDYVHDPFFMIKNPKELMINQSVPGLCMRPGEFTEGLKGLYYLEKIREHFTTMKARGYNDRYNDIKILCSVYSYEGGVQRTDTIWETWGKRCDGFFIASSESNLTTGHTHMPTMLEESRAHRYDTIWQKVRNMMAYIYDNFLESFDYFHISGDDTFLIVENLREFLSSPEVESYENIPGNLFYGGFPVYFAGLLEKERFNGGGSGYTLSRKALKAFVEGPLQNELQTQESSTEDKNVGTLIRKHLNVSASGVDTRDDVGAHRYHQFGIDRYTKDFDEWKGAFKHFTKRSLLGMEEFDMWPVVFNEDYVSTSSIAFHKMSVEEMRRYEMILYKTEIEKCGENMTQCFNNVGLTKPNLGMVDQNIC